MSTHTHAVNGIPILDFHVHFQPAYGLHGPAQPKTAPTSSAHEARDAAVAGTSAKWRRTYDFPDPERGQLLPLEEEADRWISEANNHGIERIVFVTTGGNTRGKQLAQLHPDRFTVFASTDDPFSPTTIDGIEEGLAAGYFRGVKLLAPTLPYRIDDPKGRPFWELLERYNVPVLIHFGHIGSAGGTSFNDKIEPKHLEAVAKSNPGVNFVIPHFGVQYVQQLLFLSWGTPNVYTDTSGSNQWLQWLPYELSLRDVFRKFYETAGPDRLIFGSDSSWFPRGYAYRYLQDQQRIAFELGWPDADVRKVFGGNAARLLNLDWQ